MLGKIEGRRRKGRQRMRWLDGSTDWMDRVWEMMKGKEGWRAAVHGLQTVGHDWVTEQQQNSFASIYLSIASNNLFIRNETKHFLVLLPANVSSPKGTYTGESLCNKSVICCSVTQSCLTLCDPVDCSTQGFPVLHHILEYCSSSCPWSLWCHPTISSSVVPSSSCLQSFTESVFSNESALHIRWPKYQTLLKSWLIL